MTASDSRRLACGLILILIPIVTGCRSSAPRATLASAPPERPPGAPFAIKGPEEDRRLAAAARARGSGTRRPELDEDASLDDCLVYAALSNPGLEAAFQRFRAAIEKLPQARALPDPRLTYGYFLAEVETRVGAQEQQIGLAQTFPWFGKLADRRDAAARAALAERRRFEAARLELDHRVESAYNGLYFLRRSIEITKENLELLQQFERIARARYRVAAAGHPDVIRIQLELARTEDRIRQLEELRAPSVARLNAALDRPADAPAPWPSTLRRRVTDADMDTLFARLRHSNPRLQALDAETKRERIAGEIARKEGLPDFTLGLTYTDVDGRSFSIPGDEDDALLASVSINLPIWRERVRAGVREARARQRAAAGDRAEATQRLAFELRQALFEHRDARRRVELHRDTLIPKATESLQASLASFARGTTDFLDLIDIDRSLLELQLELERAAVDRATSYRRLETLVGAPLPSSRELEPEGENEEED